jgi:hypothetical protein
LNGYEAIGTPAGKSKQSLRLSLRTTWVSKIGVVRFVVATDLKKVFETLGGSDLTHKLNVELAIDPNQKRLAYR